MPHSSFHLGLKRLNRLVLIFAAPIVLLATTTFPSSDLVAEDDLATVIERAEESVVRIEVKGEAGESLGSGFVVSADGVLVTNVHVLAGATSAIAITPTGKRYKLTNVLVVDEDKDICVAKMDAPETTPIALAEKLPRKGETVTALGAPLGLSFTATTGIISAIRPGAELGRETGEKSIRGTWVQVDAALSPGNSGGPLINRQGQVVAMSTRASAGGRAQNLNFGISIVDINLAIKESTTARLRSLAGSVGKLKNKERAPSSYVKRRDIPDASLDAYVEEGRDSYDVLSKELRRYVTMADTELKAMRKGLPYIPSSVTIFDRDWMRVRGRTSINYYFDTDVVKRRIVRLKELRVKKLKKLKKRVATSSAEESLFAILSEAGPPVDTRRAGSVGFLEGAIVLHAFNEHEMAVRYGKSVYLMWIESTVGLSLGEEATPLPVFVSGTETILIPGDTSMAVTVLQEVSKAEIKDAVFASKEFLTWRDSSGKYEIEAYFIKHDGEHVHLGKRGGGTVQVPVSRLDKASRNAVLELSK